MTLEEAINLYERQAEELYKAIPCDGCTFDKCKEEHRQVVELLKELKAYREFVDWLVKAILEDDWEESADFYAEVLCRKLTKLGKLKIVDNKYMEVNADANT